MPVFRHNSDFSIPFRKKCWRAKSNPAARRNGEASTNSLALIPAAHRKNRYITASQTRARRRANPRVGMAKSASNQVASAAAAFASFSITAGI
jgi:hypothetical protein